MGFVRDNHAKLGLILQSKDDNRSGLVNFDEFYAGLKQLGHPGITRTFATDLANMSNARNRDNVRYRAVIDLLVHHNYSGSS